MTSIVPLEHGERYVVEHCDVVVWWLAKWFNRQQLIVDVNLLVCAGESGLRGLKLALPFGVRHPSEVQDFSAGLTAAKGLPFIYFGKVEDPGAPPDAPAVIFFEDEEVPGPDRQAAVHRVTCEKVTIHREGWLSRISPISECVLVLARKLEAQERGFISVRFYVYGNTAIARWKTGFLARNGVTLDLASGDITRLKSTQSGRNLMDRAIQPKSGSVSYVLRVDHPVSFASPEPVDVALVPRGAVAPYLGRVTDLRGDSALVSYRTDNYSMVDSPEPVSLFVSALKESSIWSLGNYVRLFVLMLGAVSLLAMLGVVEHNPAGVWFPMTVSSAISSLWASTTIRAAALVPVTLLGVVQLLTLLGRFSKRLLIVPVVLARLERGFYGRRLQDDRP